MTNHVHQLVTPKQAESIPRLSIALGRRYMQYISTTYCGVVMLNAENNVSLAPLILERLGRYGASLVFLRKRCMAIIFAARFH